MFDLLSSGVCSKSATAFYIQALCVRIFSSLTSFHFSIGYFKVFAPSPKILRRDINQFELDRVEMRPPLSLLVVGLSFTALTVAHPGEYHDKVRLARQMNERSLEAQEQNELYNQCSNSVERRAMQERAYARRAERLEQLRIERGVADDGSLPPSIRKQYTNPYLEPFLHRRTIQEFRTWAQIKHDKTGVLSYNASTPVSTLFGTTPQCILTPENANGPYYVLGESIRSNVVESQVGIPLHLELQFVDVTTCKPATKQMVDIWSCSALGIYSGVSASGQGGLASTYLRGVQQTDDDGVVEFDTIFPGHYSGRASHEHIIVHSGATLNPNGTYSGGHISHLAQLFFDQSLITAVEATSPYNTNKIALTTNDADQFTGYSASAKYDPFPEYILIGGASQLSKGIFAWIEIGIRPSADYTNYGTNAAYRDATGGHENPGFNMGIVGNAPPIDTGPIGTPGNAGTTTSTKATTSSRTTVGAAPTSTVVSPPTSGTVAHYGQCGGTGWTGGTLCISPYTCTYSNAWYSQCL
jgi:protocatechuate 3,4-dioxygenase beta subunit